MYERRSDTNYLGFNMDLTLKILNHTKQLVWGYKSYELKIGNEYRVIYTVKFDDAIYVLTAFIKKTQKTPKQAIDLAKRRLKEIA